MSTGKVVPALFMSVGLGMFGSLGLRYDSQRKVEQNAQSPSPMTPGSFPCLQSRVQSSERNRVIVLHGPDWVIESSIKPSCLPERDVVFRSDVGEGLMAHPFAARIRLWVTSEDGVTHVRIVDSSPGSKQREIRAVSLVTNKKCIDRDSKNCSVKGGAVFVPVDY